MELEEMKTLWDSMSVRVSQLELINKKQVMEITQLKYKNKFSKLTNYERLGTLVCFAMGLFVLVNIEKLDTWYLLLCGMITLIFLFFLPIFSLKSLHDLSRLNLSKYTYKEVLIRFGEMKRRTLLLQRVVVVASVCMLFVSIPVADKLLNGNDFFQKEIKTSFWFAITFGVLFALFISRWGYGWYTKITNNAEGVLKDLEE